MERILIPLEEFDPDPLKEFAKWHALAAGSGNPDANAMTLATVDEQGMPSARVVLYKGMTDGGFVFYTNYESLKGRQLEKNSKAALVFYWPEIYRQVRIEGTTKKVSRSQSEAYFKTRPRESQLGAWASHQTQPIVDFVSLEKRFVELEKYFDGATIPCPPYWGGFNVVPVRIEFWVGGTRRLHQRVCFEKIDSVWKRTLLSP